MLALRGNIQLISIFTCIVKLLILVGQADGVVYKITHLSLLTVIKNALNLLLRGISIVGLSVIFGYDAIYHFDGGCSYVMGTTNIRVES